MLLVYWVNCQQAVHATYSVVSRFLFVTSTVLCILLIFYVFSPSSELFVLNSWCAWAAFSWLVKQERTCFSFSNLQGNLMRQMKYFLNILELLVCTCLSCLEPNWSCLKIFGKWLDEPPVSHIQRKHYCKGQHLTLLTAAWWDARCCNV